MRGMFSLFQPFQCFPRLDDIFLASRSVSFWSAVFSGASLHLILRVYLFCVSLCGLPVTSVSVSSKDCFIQRRKGQSIFPKKPLSLGRESFLIDVYGIEGVSSWEQKIGRAAQIVITLTILSDPERRGVRNPHINPWSFI